MRFENIFNEFVDSKLDFLNNDIPLDDFDWTIFFETYDKFSIYESLSSLSLYKDEIRKNDVRHLEYIFEIENFKYIGIFDFSKCINEISYLEKNIVKSQLDKIDTTLLNELEEVYKNNPDKFVLKYQFRDEHNNTNQTNKVGNKAFAVLKAVSTILLNGISKIGLDNIICLEMHILKEESKRLEIYKKLIQRNLSFDALFKNEYIDTTTDKNYLTYYRWK